MFEKLNEGWQSAMPVIFTLKTVLEIGGAVAYEKGSEALAIPYHTVVRLFNYNESMDFPESDLESGTENKEGDILAKLVWIDCILDLPSATLSKAKQLWRSALPTLPGDASIHDHANSNQGIFRVDQTCLMELIQNRDGDRLQKMGGVAGVASALGTDMEKGINGDAEDVHRQMKDFGSNVYMERPKRRFLSFMWEAFKDVVLVTLLVCAAFFLGFGINKRGFRKGWYDGGSIFFAVFAVITVFAAYNFWQYEQLDWLCRQNYITVNVIRSGRRQKIEISQIVVGDVVRLSIGDRVPADGLFLDRHSVQVDEPSMAGDSRHVKVDRDRPLLLSGSTVADGHGHMLVISVGMNTTWGKMMSSISRDNSEQTPLQARLNKLNSSIGTVGLAVAFLVLVILLLHYFVGNTRDENGNREFVAGQTTGDDIINSVAGVIAAVMTIVMVVFPKSLPLALTLTLAYLTKRMMADKVMVRKLSACETMGLASTICTDKTGCLTLNQMTVVALWVGHCHELEDVCSLVSKYVLDLIRDGVALNTMGDVYWLSSESGYEISGSPTEKAILLWGVSFLRMDMEETKKSCEVIQVEAFNSQKKRSGVLIRKIVDDTFHVHWKGAAEMVLAMCSSFYDQGGIERDLEENQRIRCEKEIEDMGKMGLRCIAFAHKQVSYLDEDEQIRLEQISQERAESSSRCTDFTHKQVSEVVNKKRENRKRIPENGLTLLGFVGIKNPCRPDVADILRVCHSAQVNIKMITGDNIFTAKAIAMQCGILKGGEDDFNGAIVEGDEFRSYTPEERLQRVEKIQVMARSSPFDKLLMVQCLKQKGHVVAAMFGDNMKDALSLKEADIRLSMGISGTEAAKECSDIVSLDDDFASTAKAIRWGRCIQHNVPKFIQFQLTALTSTLVITMVAAVTSGSLPLTAVQLLWVSLIVHILGAVALNTGLPTDDLMRKHPVAWNGPLVTNIMWRNLVAQVSYQVTVLLILQFKGELLYMNQQVKNASIFNTLVLCQVFNLFNCRKLEEINVFKGIIRRHKLLWAVSGGIVLVQVAMMELLVRFAGTERLNWKQWGVCIAMGAVSWPLSWVLKGIPVPERPFKSYMKWKK